MLVQFFEIDRSETKKTMVIMRHQPKICEAVKNAQFFSI